MVEFGTGHRKLRKSCFGLSIFHGCVPERKVRGENSDTADNKAVNSRPLLSDNKSSNPSTKITARSNSDSRHKRHKASTPFISGGMRLTSATKSGKPIRSLAATASERLPEPCLP